MDISHSAKKKKEVHFCLKHFHLFVSLHKKMNIFTVIVQVQSDSVYEYAMFNRLSLLLGVNNVIHLYFSIIV